MGMWLLIHAEVKVACDYLSMLGLTFNLVSKKGSWDDALALQVFFVLKRDWCNQNHFAAGAMPLG